MTAYTLYQKGWEITQTRKTVPVRTGLKTTACIILQIGKESVTDGKAESNVSSRPFQSWDRNNQYLQTHSLPSKPSIFSSPLCIISLVLYSA